jgi:type I restriction enzyme S subunit
MELKPGYKHTEVGVIPEDWQVLKAVEVCELVVDCKNRTPPVIEGGSFAVVRTPNVRNGNFVRNDLRFTDEQSFRTWTRRAVPKRGDVLITREAPLGEVCLVPSDLPVCLGQRMMLYRPDSETTESEFLLYALMATGVRNNLLRKIGGSTVGHAKVDDIRDLQLPIPATRLEQEAIAEALSNADALIKSLEQLLVKKRQIKQGTMQELLTGKKRLPGFTSKWESRLFGEIAQPRKQRIDPRRTERSEFCVELEHIEQGTGSLGGYTATGKESSLKSVFKKDDVLFGKLRAYLRKYWLADREGVCSTEIWVLMANPASLIPPYLFQLVRTDRFIEAATTAYGTHMPRSDWKVVKNFELLVPAPEEQTAIADILSDMDAEIAAVETKLTKARQIKQGMMQELLTGRIRLARPSAEVLSFPAKESASVVSVPHNTQINEAVVIAVLSAKFGSETFPLGRFRRTKFSYLLHRHVEHEATGFLKKAAGPYNPRTRYGGAEKIALQSRYVRVVSTGKSEGFVADDNIAQAEGYFEKWYGAEALTWLEQFRYQKNDALELLTTVDMACEDLSRVGKAATLFAVKQIIQDSPEWKAKLNRAVFSDDNIATTIQSCGQLFPIEEE